MSWLEHLSNSRTYHIKKTMFDILQDRYSQNEQIIERIGIGLATESDTMAFFNLIRDVYEVAFTKCVNEQKEQLAKLGYQVKIVAETKK